MQQLPACLLLTLLASLAKSLPIDETNLRPSRSGGDDLHLHANATQDLDDTISKQQQSSNVIGRNLDFHRPMPKLLNSSAVAESANGSLVLSSNSRSLSGSSLGEGVSPIQIQRVESPPVKQISAAKIVPLSRPQGFPVAPVGPQPDEGLIIKQTLAAIVPQVQPIVPLVIGDFGQQQSPALVAPQTSEGQIVGQSSVADELFQNEDQVRAIVQDQVSVVGQEAFRVRAKGQVPVRVAVQPGRQSQVVGRDQGLSSDAVAEQNRVRDEAGVAVVEPVRAGEQSPAVDESVRVRGQTPVIVAVVQEPIVSGVRDQTPVAVAVEPVRDGVQSVGSVGVEEPVRVRDQRPVENVVQEPLRSADQSPAVAVAQDQGIPVVQEPIRVRDQDPVVAVIQEPGRIGGQEPVVAVVQEPVRVRDQDPVGADVQGAVRVGEQRPVVVAVDEPVRVRDQSPVVAVVQEPVRVRDQGLVVPVVQEPVRVGEQDSVVPVVQEPVRVRDERPDVPVIQEPVRVRGQRPNVPVIQEPVRVRDQNPVVAVVQVPVRIDEPSPIAPAIQEPVRVREQNPVVVVIQETIRLRDQDSVQAVAQEPVRIRGEDPIGSVVQEPVRVVDQAQTQTGILEPVIVRSADSINIDPENKGPFHGSHPVFA